MKTWVVRGLPAGASEHICNAENAIEAVKYAMAHSRGMARMDKFLVYDHDLNPAIVEILSLEEKTGVPLVKFLTSEIEEASANGTPMA